MRHSKVHSVKVWFKFVKWFSEGKIEKVYDDFQKMMRNVQQTREQIKDETEQKNKTQNDK